MSDQSAAQQVPITIKKYANRRLYNTATSSYVTLDDLSQMVKAGQEFLVFDAKSGEDITRSVLTQIIVEEEQKGENLLPISFLRQLISFYGDNMQWLVPRYLEHTMKSFAHNQDQMRKNLHEAFGGLFPFGGLEEVGKQNMAIFESTMKMFSPFKEDGTDASEGDKAAPVAGKTDAGKSGADKSGPSSAEAQSALKDLTDRLNALQSQIDSLTKKNGD